MPPEPAGSTWTYEQPHVPQVTCQAGIITTAPTPDTQLTWHPDTHVVAFQGGLDSAMLAVTEQGLMVGGFGGSNESLQQQLLGLTAAREAAKDAAAQATAAAAAR